MESFYGGRPGRDFAIRTFRSIVDLNNDKNNANSPVPLGGYAILVTSSQSALYQKRYDNSSGSIVYDWITDLTGAKGDPGPTEADKIDYDNSQSGLAADNLQDAFDELAADFQDGCDSIVQALTAKGYPPADNSPTEIVTSIENINQYPGFIVPLEYDYEAGYIASSGTKWTYEPAPNGCHSDIYEVKENHSYQLWIGNLVGSRFRGVILATDPRTVTSGSLNGTKVVLSEPPTSLQSTSIFTSQINGYLVFQKDNNNTVGPGIRTYLMDRTVM